MTHKRAVFLPSDITEKKKKQLPDRSAFDQNEINWVQSPSAWEPSDRDLNTNTGSRLRVESTFFTQQFSSDERLEKRNFYIFATKIDFFFHLPLSAAFSCPLVALVSPFGGTAPVHCVYFEDKPAVCSLSIARGAAGLLPWFAAMRPVIEPETTAPPPRFSSQGEKMTQERAGHTVRGEKKNNNNKKKQIHVPNTFDTRQTHIKILKTSVILLRNHIFCQRRGNKELAAREEN